MSSVAGVTPASAAKTFGSNPGGDVANAASAAGPCAQLGANRLAGMMMSISGLEVNNTPSPMTQSRYDIVNSLAYDGSAGPGTSYEVFWHPGIGQWQMDEAGDGRPYASYERVNTPSAAANQAGVVRSFFNCGSSSWNTSGMAGHWFACASSDCVNDLPNYYDAGTNTLIYTKDSSVGSAGGMVAHSCGYKGGNPSRAT